MDDADRFNLDPHPADPLVRISGHRGRHEHIEVIPAPDGPWFNAGEVCKALGIPLSSSSWMPPEWACKVVGMSGRKVQAVNALGLFALCNKAARGSNPDAYYQTVFLRPDQEDYTPLQFHQIRAAQALIGALMSTYPQKPRGTASKKTQQISEGVSDKP